MRLTLKAAGGYVSRVEMNLPTEVNFLSFVVQRVRGKGQWDASIQNAEPAVAAVVVKSRGSGAKARASDNPPHLALGSRLEATGGPSKHWPRSTSTDANTVASCA